MAVSAQSPTIFDELSAIGIYALANANPFSAPQQWALYNGIVLGLQQNPDNTEHSCYLSFGSFSAAVDSVPSFLTQLQNPPPSSSQNSIMAQFNLPWYEQPASYFLLAKRLSEIGSVYFDFYK